MQFTDYENTDEKILEQAVEIITKRILTPVLYMFADGILEFICFCDSKTSEEDFRSTEFEIFTKLGLECEIIDIRSFDEADRAAIVSKSKPVYTAHEMMEKLFINAMNHDLAAMAREKQAALKRKIETGSFYLS
jgi:hypothetical protein